MNLLPKLAYLFLAFLNLKKKAQSFLTQAHIAKIADSYRAFESVDGFTAVVTNEEILANNGNLNIVTYVKRDTAKGNLVDLPAALESWQAGSISVRSAANDLFKLLHTGRTKK